MQRDEILAATFGVEPDRHVRLEGEIRTALGLDPAVGTRENGLLIPDPRSLRWLEIFCGHRLQCTPGVAPEVRLRNHRRVVEFGGGAPSTDTAEPRLRIAAG